MRDDCFAFAEYREGVDDVLEIRADNGHGRKAKIELYLRPGIMRVKQSCNGLLPGLGCLPAGTSTGMGVVTNLYKRAIAESLCRGLRFESDYRVSESAARVWHRLAKDGYAIYKNPDAVFLNTDPPGPEPSWRTRDESSVFKLASKPVGVTRGANFASSTSE